MVFEENGVFVQPNEAGDWVVFRPSRAGTHAESDSAYSAGINGLGIAIARAMYLARGPERGQAKEAMRLANEAMSKAKSHGRAMRDAMASFDAEFLS
jgi:hypothetical protein